MRYVCHHCQNEFEQYDFSDVIWKLFCCLACAYAWCRKRMPEPVLAKSADEKKKADRG